MRQGRTRSALIMKGCEVLELAVGVEGSDGGPAQRGLGLGMSAPRRSPINIKPACRYTQLCTAQITGKLGRHLAGCGMCEKMKWPSRSSAQWSVRARR
jgi:hypothetical protein